jgi:hypothetical protein
MDVSPCGPRWASRWWEPSPTVVGAVTNGGGDVTLTQGFWHGAKLGHAIYLPLTLRNDQP